MVEVVVMLPGIDGILFTTIFIIFEVVGAHTPLLTSALKNVVDTSDAVVYAAVVAPLPPVTFIQFDVPSVDCCHCILPVYDVRFKVVLLPEQIEVPVAVAVPPRQVELNAPISGV